MDSGINAFDSPVGRAKTTRWSRLRTQLVVRKTLGGGGKLSARETSIWCALMGVTALGAAAVAAGATAPLSLPLVATGTAAALAANITATKLCDLWNRFKDERLARLDAGKTLDANHDEARAIREAQLEALRALVQRYKRYAKTFDRDFEADKAFADAALRWVEAEIGSSPTLELGHDPVVEAVIRKTIDDALMSQLQTPRAPTAIQLAEALRRSAEHAVLDELTAAVRLEAPRDFTEWFFDQKAGWFAGFTVQISAKIKHRPEVAAIWAAARIALLGEHVEAIEAELAALHDLAKRVAHQLFGEPPVAMYVPRLQSVAAQDRFSFKNLAIPFTGRESELAELDEFLDSPEPFLWHMITGGGGAGKSRLALELCLRRDGPWRVGFAREESSGGGFTRTPKSDWEPQAQHLIVVDYLLANARMVEAILGTFSARATPFDHKIRVLLIERESTPFVESQVWGSSSARQEIRVSRWRPDPLRLQPQANDDVWSLSAAFRKGALVTRDEFLRHHKEIDPERRTLTALVLAEAYGRGEGAVDTLSDLLEQLLVHERRVWRGAGIRADVEEQMLAFTTMVDGFVPNRDGSRIPAALLGKLDLTVKGGSVDRLRLIAPPQPDGSASLGRYLPDLVGEYLVLDILDRACLPHPITGEVERSWLLDAAWRSEGGEPMAEFVARTRRDFPHLCDRLALDAPVRGVAPSYFVRASFILDRALSSGTSLSDAVHGAFLALSAHCDDDAAFEASAEFLECVMLLEISSIDPSLISAEMLRLTRAASSLSARAMDRWAKCAKHYIAHPSAADPADARMVLDTLEACSLREASSPTLLEEWARGVTSYISRPDGAVAPEARELLDTLEAHALASDASPSLLLEWARSVVHYIARTGSAVPSEAREVFGSLEGRALVEGASPDLLEEWARCVVDYIPTVSEPETKHALLNALETRALAGASQTVLKAWAKSILNGFAGMAVVSSSREHVLGRAPPRSRLQSQVDERHSGASFYAHAAVAAPSEARARLNALEAMLDYEASTNLLETWARSVACLTFGLVAAGDLEGAANVYTQAEWRERPLPAVALGWGIALGCLLDACHVSGDSPEETWLDDLLIVADYASKRPLVADVLVPYEDLIVQRRGR